MLRINSIIKENVPFAQEKNLLHFISKDEERPLWSKRLNEYHCNHPDELNMKERYDATCKNVKHDSLMQEYFQYITEADGFIVDLASGPSGYFAPVFQFLKDDSMFIATDACKAVIEAHQEVNKEERFCILDVDLDKPLPFKDECIDAFSGNLLSNVDNYRELLSEIGRCLKHKGRFAVIETFYEAGTKTYEYLKEREMVYASYDHYIEICKQFHLELVEKKLRKEIIGKIDEGDFLPIGENDKCDEMVLLFEKR